MTQLAENIPYYLRPITFGDWLISLLPGGKSRIEREYIRTYYKVVVSEYYDLPPDARNSLGSAIAQRICELNSTEQSSTLDWTDVYELEIVVIGHQPLEDLRRRAWLLRTKFENTVPKATFDAYLRSSPPDASSADPDNEEALRADLTRLVKEFQWRYLIIETGERIRDRLSKQNGFILIMALLFGMVWLGVTALSANRSDPSLSFIPIQAKDLLDDLTRVPIVFAVFLAGVMGGVFSTYNRIQKLRIGGGEPVEELVKLNQGRWSIVMSPFLGGAFAVILYILMAGKLLQSSLFPMMHAANTVDYSPPAAVWLSMVPDHVEDAAQLLIWGFIAGFAERFVPDALDRIAATAKVKSADAG